MIKNNQINHIKIIYEELLKEDFILELEWCNLTSVSKIMYDKSLV